MSGGEYVWLKEKNEAAIFYQSHRLRMRDVTSMLPVAM